MRKRLFLGVVLLGALGLGIASGCGAAATKAGDPPLLVPWTRIGDIALGGSKAKVEAEYGTVGHGFHVLQRYGNSVQGEYLLHGSEVDVTFAGNVVNDIDFVTPYYRTKSGFGIGSRIPVGACHRVPGNACEHHWRGFVLYPRWKDSPCNCWVHVGGGAVSLSSTGTKNFLKPWFFIFTKDGRAEEFYFAWHYSD